MPGHLSCPAYHFQEVGRTHPRAEEVQGFFMTPNLALGEGVPVVSTSSPTHTAMLRAESMSILVKGRRRALHTAKGTSFDTWVSPKGVQGILR